MRANAALLAYSSVLNSSRGVIAGGQHNDGETRHHALLRQQGMLRSKSLLSNSKGVMVREQSIDGVEKVRTDALLTQQIISQPLSLFSSSRGVMGGGQNIDGVDIMRNDASLAQQIRPQPMMSLMNITENLGTISLDVTNELLAQPNVVEPDAYKTSAYGSELMHETKVTVAQRAVLAEVLRNRGNNLGAFLDVFV